MKKKSFLCNGNELRHLQHFARIKEDYDTPRMFYTLIYDIIKMLLYTDTIKLFLNTFSMKKAFISCTPILSINFVIFSQNDCRSCSLVLSSQYQSFVAASYSRIMTGTDEAGIIPTSVIITFINLLGVIS